MKKIILLIPVFILLVPIVLSYDANLIAGYGLEDTEYKNMVDNDWGLAVAGDPVIMLGKIGNAVDCDGVGDSLENTSFNPVTGASARSLMFWLNTTTETNGDFIFSYGQEGVGEYFEGRVKVSGGEGFFSFMGYGADVDFVNTTIINDGEWHHIVVMYDGTDVTAYVNDVLIFKESKTLNTGTQFHFGLCVQTLDGSVGTVTLDEFCIFDDILTPTEININYNSGVGRANCAIEEPPTTPELSNIDCTSNPEGDSTEPYNSTGDLTPTFTLDTDVNADCDISDSNITHWTACGTTGGTSHTCTLPYEYHLTVETDYMYVNCSNVVGSVYDELEVWTIEKEAVGATGDTIELWQSIKIVNYTNTELVWNRSICAINLYATNKSLNIPTLAGWTLTSGTNPLPVEAQSKNCTHYENITFRPMHDEIINIGTVTIGSDITENFTMGNLIDPPHAFIKDGVANCSYNTIIDTEMNMSYTLILSGAGVFRLNERLTVGGLYKPDTDCILYFPDDNNGEVYIPDV